jgi:MFS family permease
MTTTGAPRDRSTVSTSAEAPAGAFWTPLLVTGASIFLFTLDAGLMSVSLPDVEAGFPDASRATISWVATGQGVAIVSLMLVAGRFADRNGRRRVFRLGMVLFGIGAVITGAAQEPMLLIAGRVLQGVGGALFNAVALAMALREVPDHRRAEAVGFWGTIGSVGAILGPTGGALLVDAWGWRAVFLATAPLSLITAAVARVTLRESADPHDAGPAPVLDVVLVATGVGSVAIALSQSGRWGWDSASTLGLLLGGSVLLAAVVSRSRRPGAIIDLRLFGNRSYSVATLAASIQQFGFLPWFVSIPFVLRGCGAGRRSRPVSP